MRKVAVFIGRFQPFHEGHEFAIRKAMEKYDVIIGIGSAQEAATSKNPFTFAERARMIRKKIPGARIFAVDDVGDDAKWEKQVQEKVEKGFGVKIDVAITGNAWTRRCFEKAGIPVEEVEWLEPQRFKGTKYRKGMGLEHEETA
jgi:nicotinamide-nucleotide adenylyltransferase